MSGTHMAEASTRVLNSVLTHLSRAPQYPLRRTFGNRVDALVDYVREEDKPQLYSLFKATAKNSQGAFSKGQFLTPKEVDDLLAVGSNLCFKDMSRGGKMFGFTNVYPSPLCRSNTPVMHAGYAMMDADYRGKGLSADLTVYYTLLGVTGRYHGTLGRTSISSTGAIFGGKYNGGVDFVGIIPDGLYSGDGHWVDELVTNTDYFKEIPDLHTRFQDKGVTFQVRSTVADIPPLKMEAARKLCQPKDISVDAERFGTTQELFSTAGSTLVTGKQVYLELAGPGAVEVEEMIRAAAQRGEGFALDEFDEDGLLNRRLLRRQTATLVARRRSDHVLIGGAVLGPSTLPRAIQPCSLGGYIIVGKQFQRQGYGSEMMMLCERIAQKLGYTNITTDLLCGAKTPGSLSLAMNQGYMVRGQLPKCAFIKDIGLTSSFLLCKKLSEDQPMSKL